MQLLAKQPTQRYDSADEVANDLQRFLRGEPVRARSPHGWNWLVRKYRQHLVLASVSSFGALLLVGLVLSLTIAFTHANWRVTELEMEKLELLQTLDTERAVARRALVKASQSTQPAVDVTRWIEHAVAELPRNPKLSALLAAHAIRMAKAYPDELQPVLEATIQHSPDQAPDALILALTTFAQRELTDSEKSRYGITQESPSHGDSAAPAHQPTSTERATQR